jgi:predicted choloylglycine hydrolase
MRFRFKAMEEMTPGPKWKLRFQRLWPAYRKWFLSEGDAVRPSYLESRTQFGEYMPELLPTYDTLTELAGGGDTAARLLALYCPPPYLTGCSQAVWMDDAAQILVRNYDYHPDLAEAAVYHTCWNGRRVIAMSDCLWGVLDGINDAGLVVSLTFGGNRVVGKGFGIPIVLRYILEFCETTDEAMDVLRRVPPHMAYNVTALDAQGRFKTAYLCPGETPVTRQFPVATNHQGTVEWLEHARATATLERERFLISRFVDKSQTETSFIEAFLHPPLYSRAYKKGYGTLYTSVYRPLEKSLELLWPGGSWRHSFDNFDEGAYVTQFVDEDEFNNTRIKRMPEIDHA